MPQEITSGIRTAKDTLHNLAPWIWLFEVRVNDTEAYRFAGHDSEAVYLGNTFYPAPIIVETIETSKEGTLSNVNATVANVSGIIGKRVRSGELLDRKVNVWVQNGTDTGLTIPFGVFTIREAEVSLLTVGFTLSTFAISEVPFPNQRFSRTICRFGRSYGGAGCEYDTSLPNAISGTNPLFDPTDCDLTKDGPNGCTVHGDNEVANGKPRLHPLRWGATPGIPVTTSSRIR